MPRDFRKEITVPHGRPDPRAPLRNLQGVIPEARLLVSPKTITCKPEHSRRHKQNLINELRRRRRAEGRK